MKRLIQYALVLVLLTCTAFAQSDPGQDNPGQDSTQTSPTGDGPSQDTEDDPADTTSDSSAQANPVSVRADIFLVSTVDGEETFVETNEARPGQIIEYRLTATNVGDVNLPTGSVSVTGPIPETTQYVPDSATPSSEAYTLEGSSDGENFAEPDANDTQTNYSILRWALLDDMEPGAEVTLSYRVTVTQE